MAEKNITVECEQAETLISRRIDGELSPSDAPLLDAHLNACAACRERLVAWSYQSDLLAAELSSLWPKELAARSLPLAARASRNWAHLGLAASAMLALGGICLFLIGKPAVAPPLAQTVQPATVPQASSTPLVAQASSLAVVSLPPEPVIAITNEFELDAALATETPPPEVAGSASILPANAPPVEKKEIALAALRDAPAPKLIPNVSLDYALDVGGGRIERGRLILLGDVFAGRAVLRFVDEGGSIREAAQADVDTVLPEPYRAATHRFLARCAEEPLRARLQDALKRQDE